MSGRLQQKALLSKHHLSQEHSLVFTNTPNYNTYDQQLEHNLRIILKKYPHLDRHKVNNLLEQLENNLELALQILEEEEIASNKILEQKRGDIKKSLNLTATEENRILKRSFLNLYKKMTAVLKDKEDLQKKLEHFKSQNDYLRNQNRMLLQSQYKRECLNSNTDIC